MATLLLTSLFVASATRSGSPPIFEVPTEAYTYTVWKEGSTFYCKDGLLGNVSSSADDDALVQSAINAANAEGGGTVFVKANSYSASVTVKANVMLILEAGVSGVTYTVNSGGYCIRYSGGYAWFEVPLNMTGEEIRFGAFHTGSSAPASISIGQWWYDTSSKVLKVWSGIDWDAVSGAAGPAGPAGKVEGMDYKYMVFVNATAAYLMNGDTGDVDDYSTDHDDVIKWAWGNLTAGRTWKETVVLKGDFDYNGPRKNLIIPSYSRTVLLGEIKVTPTCPYGEVLYSNYTTQIEFVGGELDGNSGNRPPPTYCDTGIAFVSVTDFIIRDVRIHHMQSTASGGLGRGIQLNSCEEGTIDNLRIMYCIKTGIETHYCNDINIVNCQLLHNDELNNGGFLSIQGTVGEGGETRRVAIMGNHFWNNTAASHPFISLYNVSSVLIVGNTFNQSNSYAVRMGRYTTWPYGHTSHCIVKGNTIQDCSSGINICGDFNIVSENVIKDTANNAILLGACYNATSFYTTPDHNLIANNIIDGAIEGIYFSSSVVNHGCNNTITGNHIYNCSNDGVVFTDNSDDNVVTDNTFRSCTLCIYFQSGCDDSFVDGNDFRFNSDDVTTGANAIWGDNVDVNGNFDQGSEP